MLYEEYGNKTKIIKRNNQNHFRFTTQNSLMLE